MTDGVGRTLRKARTERGIELGEIEGATKIRVKFLRAMEEDRWEELPAPVYARSFLSTYARFLDLDDAALVEEYKRTAEGGDQVEPVPSGVIHPGGRKRSRSIFTRARSTKPVAIVLAGLVGAVVLGVLIVSLLGTDDGREVADRGGRPAGSSALTTKDIETGAAPSSRAPSAQASEVSLELRPTGTVWVCLVDGDRRVLVGETLTADEVRGPFDSRAFEVTFGNGSVEMTVDGRPTAIPPVPNPLGYRISSSGVRKLDPSAQPSCG